MTHLKTTYFAVAALIALAAAQIPSADAQQAPADVREIELNGVIQPSQVVDVSGGVLAGVLEEILVDRGDDVQEGELLAILDSRLDEANLKVAQARVDLVAALEASLAARDYYADAYERAQSLFEEGVLSTELRDQAEEEALLAESRWRVEQESHTLYRMQLEQAKVALEMRRIVSPLSGVVVDRMVDPGEFVGQATLLSIAQLDPLYVEVVAPAALYGSIRIGSDATVVPGDPVGGSYMAKVSVVDKVLDAASNTFRVRLELPNPGNQVPAGLRARVLLRLQ
ncbi:MAG: efflux RND transporter periplasmic adaptor subunit [Acidobacteriota bacterium]|jgi:RND family efflux transporter MFP subunit